MKQQNLPLEVFLKGFADSAAINFHQFSKKCLTTMKTILQNQENRKNYRKNRLLEECRLKIKQQRRTQSPEPANAVLQQQQDSRIARINRIKDAIESKKNEGEQKRSYKDIETVFWQFGQQLKPQILSKYPKASNEKIQKVILQKWNTIDPVKKEYYIAKILARIKNGQLLLPKQAEDSTEQQPEEHQELNEIKREEDPPTQEEPENRFSQYLSRIRSKDQRNEEPNVETDQIASQKLADKQAEEEVPSNNQGSPLSSQELKQERKVCNKTEEMSKIEEQNDE